MRTISRINKKIDNMVKTANENGDFILGDEVTPFTVVFCTTGRGQKETNLVTMGEIVLWTDEWDDRIENESIEELIIRKIKAITHVGSLINSML